MYDDNHNFYEILEPSEKNFLWFWSDGNVLGVYEPISLMIKATVTHYIGFHASVWHQVLTTFHLVNVCHLYFILCYLIRSLAGGKIDNITLIVGCSLGASFWGTMPFNVQTVCWLSCCSYIFAFFFLMCSLVCCVFAHGSSNYLFGGFWYFHSIIMFGIACLCKPAALSFAFCYPILDLTYSSYRTDVWKDRSLIYRMGFVLFRSIVACIRQVIPLSVGFFIWWQCQPNSYHLEEIVRLDLVNVVLRASFLIFFYPLKMLGLLDHDYAVMQPLTYDGMDPFYNISIICAGGFFFLLAASWTVLSGRKSSTMTYDVFCFLLFVATMSAGLGLSEHTTDQLYADRYGYIPGLWLSLFLSRLCGDGISFLLRDRMFDEKQMEDKSLYLSKVFKIFIALLAPILLGINTIGVSSNLDHWRSNLQLWHHATKVQPNFHRWWWAYAQEVGNPDLSILTEEQRFASINASEQAIKIYPAAHVHYGIAKHYMHMQDWKNATKYFKKAIKHHDSNEEQRTKDKSFQNQQARYLFECGVGRAYVQSKKFKSADKHLTYCLQNLPAQASANCMRRSKSTSPYKHLPSLPPGTFWHQQPGDNGRPGVLCSLPECSAPCYAFYMGLAKTGLKEYTTANQYYQTAVQQGYNHTAVFVNWVSNNYQAQHWQYVLEVGNHILSHESLREPDLRRQVTAMVDYARQQRATTGQKENKIDVQSETKKKKKTKKKG